MKYEKSKAIYSCCGKYFACTNAVADKKPVCDSCGAKLTVPLRVPKIVIVKS